MFQLHLWCGLSLGLYIFFISITGSVLVYRNELYRMTTPEPYLSALEGAELSDTELQQLAMQAWPGFRISRFNRSRNTLQGVEIWLEQDGQLRKRYFDPISGADVGSAEAVGFTLVTKLIQVHESFLAGTAGRRLNGFAGMGVVLVLLTGLLIWWPGVGRWRQSLRFRRGISWRRQVWDLHSMFGFWTAGFMLIFALSGVYLCFPESFHAFADRLQPMNEENIGERLVDRILYWLAFLHFGRINGIGLPCDGPGLCDQGVKAVWAVVGLAPALMFLTGATMWWNRVLRRWLKQAAR